VKLRIIVLMLCGVAGVGASFALASGGRHADAGPCRHGSVVFGTASAPQTFTVTVSRGWRHSNLTPGQKLNVVLGSTGQTVRFSGVGCVGTDGTLTVREAGFVVVSHHGRGGDGGSTTTTTATTTETTTTEHTTTTDHTTTTAPTTTSSGTTTTTPGL
jgi:hypothetical protein